MSESGIEHSAITYDGTCAWPGCESEPVIDSDDDPRCAEHVDRLIPVGGVEHVLDETLEDAAFELRQFADHIGWTDQRRAAEYEAIADHLLELRECEQPSGLLTRIREVFGG